MSSAARWMPRIFTQVLDPVLKFPFIALRDVWVLPIILAPSNPLALNSDQVHLAFWLYRSLVIIVVAICAIYVPRSLDLRIIWVSASSVVVYYEPALLDLTSFSADVFYLDAFIFVAGHKFSPFWQAQGSWVSAVPVAKLWAVVHLKFCWRASQFFLDWTNPAAWTWPWTLLQLLCHMACLICMLDPLTTAYKDYYDRLVILYLAPFYVTSLAQTLVVAVCMRLLGHLQRPHPLSTLQPQNSVYEKRLSERQIRLLILDRGTRFVPLSGYFEIVSLDAAPRFTAVSYTWGSNENPSAVQVRSGQGTVNLSITASAMAVLRREQSLSRSKRVWIDALCINQDDVEEKTSQIKRMRDIYRRAASVRCYLEPTLKFPNLSPFILWEVMWKVYKADQIYRPFEYPIWNHQEQIAAIFESPWLRRKWVIQEVAVARNARNIEFIYGGTSFTWAAFVELVDLVKESKPETNLLAAGSPTAKVKLAREQGAASAQAIVKIRDRVQGEGGVPLHELLFLSSSFFATVPHDQVFAVVGVASARARAELRIDYSLPIEILYMQVAYFIVDEYGAATYMQHLHQTQPSSWPNFPSWVTDWSGIESGIAREQELPELRTFDYAAAWIKSETMMFSRVQPFAHILAITETVETKHSEDSLRGIEDVISSLRLLWQDSLPKIRAHARDKYQSFFESDPIMRTHLKRELNQAFCKALNSCGTPGTRPTEVELILANEKLMDALFWFLDPESQHEEPPYKWDHDVESSSHSDKIRLAMDCLMRVSHYLHDGKRLAYLGGTSFAIVPSGARPRDILCLVPGPAEDVSAHSGGQASEPRLISILIRKDVDDPEEANHSFEHRKRYWRGQSSLVPRDPRDKHLPARFCGRCWLLDTSATWPTRSSEDLISQYAASQYAGSGFFGFALY